MIVSRRNFGCGDEEGGGVGERGGLDIGDVKLKGIWR